MGFDEMRFLSLSISLIVVLLYSATNRMVRACHALQQALPNHPSGHLGGWATPWSAEELLAGRRQRVDIPAYVGTAHDDVPQKRLEEDLC